MIHFLTIFTLMHICFSITSAVAQQQQIQFIEVKPVLKAALSQMPIGSRSLQFGTLKIGTRGINVVVHTYIIGVRHIKRDDVVVDVVNLYRMDLFRRARVNNKDTLHKLNSIQFEVAGRMNLVYAQWLDAKTKRFPVFVLQGASAGFGRKWLTMVFTLGTSKLPVVQEFEDSFNLESSTSISFDGVDERGYMMVIKSFREGGSEPSASDISLDTSLYWNGKEFVSRQKDPEPHNK